MSLLDLDDPTKTCVFLSASDEADDADVLNVNLDSGDLPNGYELRLDAYRRTWTECLDRIQSIVRALHEPVVTTVAESIRTAYSPLNVLPGLPYPELPVIAVSAAGGSNTVILDVVDALNTQKSRRNKGKQRQSNVDIVKDASEEYAADVLLSHVYPADCANLTSTMKTIIGGFVDQAARSEAEGTISLPLAIHRKATTSLASHDVNLLRVWYDALIQLNADKPPLLAIVMHDFEKVDVTIIQDVFCILSQQIPALPISFVLSMSTPSPATYLHATFPRSSLALLRMQIFVAPSGRDVIENVIEQTFFSPNFEPKIALGHGSLDFLSDFCSRHSALLDATLSILQIAHLKHFEEPLSVLVHDTDLRKPSTRKKHPLHDEANLPLLESLLGQLATGTAEADDENAYSTDVDAELWKNASVESLVSMVDDARESFHRRATSMRVGYQVLTRTRLALQDQGIKVTMPATREETPLEFMSRVVRGRVGRDVGHLVMTVKKLSCAQLEKVLSELHTFIESLSPELQAGNTAAQELIRNAQAELAESPDKDFSPEVAASVADWLKEYLSARLVRLDAGRLWHIWCTGSTPFPSELINPAPRPTIINALLHPDEVLREFELLTSDTRPESDTDGAPVATESWQLPDTSILFRLYMEAGRMVNVYDWYQAFAQVLDAQRRELMRQGSSSNGPKGKSKGKKNDKGKGKAKAKERTEDVALEDMPEEEREEWDKEVHARFICALHELDFMGFVKHTGRKADHVVRTVYDIPD